MSKYPPWPLLPTLIILVGFFILPFMLMVAISFANRGLYGGIEWSVTLSNYLRVWDPLYGQVFVRSMILAALTTVVCVLLGFPLAYAAARAASVWQPLLVLLIMIPFWTNFLVRTYAWMVILRTEGLLNWLLATWGMREQPLELLYTNVAVLIGLVHGYLPFMVLALYVAIERIPRAVEEAARDLYANGWAVFRRVVFPLARPGFLAGSVLVFVPSLGALITPHLLGGGQRMMVGTLIQHEFLVVRDWPFGSAISLVLMAIVVIVVFKWLTKAEHWNVV